MARTPGVAPAPPAKSAPVRVRPPRLAPRPPDWKKRVLVGCNILIAVCLLGAGLLYGYVSYRNGQIKRQRVAGLGDSGGGPQTILVVGSDSRANLAGQDSQTFGVGAVGTAGQRSDTIMLVHLDPATKRATLMSIPRDLWVQIPGTQHRDRINTTFNNGPDLLVRAIREDLGITVNHFLEIDFNSFRGIVNAVGAVHVYFPTPARDVYSGLNITTPGCYGLDGNMALTYVRSRHFTYYDRGSWHQEGLSDLARIKRQQDFIKKIMGKAINAGFNNPATMNRVLGSLASNLTVDTGFHLSDMFRLGRRYRSFTPDQLPSTTLPTTPAVIGGADVLELQQGPAQQAINDFLLIPPPAPTTTQPVPTNIAPADVRVQVLNGSGRTGQAASVAAALRQAGFGVSGTGRADSYGYATPVIRYGPGQEDKARYLQSLVIGGAQLQPAATPVGTDVVVVTGSSYGGLQTAGSGTSGSNAVATAPTVPAPPTTAPALPGTPTDAPLPPCPA